MAASLDEKTLEKIFEVLNLLQEKLVSTIRACEEHLTETEFCIREGRQLFKPWPAKKEVVEEDDVENRQRPMNEVCVSNTNMDPRSLSQEKLLTTNRQQSPEAKMKTEEKEDMELLDKILTKAQKVRDIQTKDFQLTQSISQLETSSAQQKPRKSAMAAIKSADKVRNCNTKASSARPSATSSQTLSKIRHPAPRAPVLKSTYTASYTRPTSGSRLSKTSSSHSAANNLNSVSKNTTVNSAKNKVLKKDQGVIKGNFASKRDVPRIPKVKCNEGIKESSIGTNKTETLAPIQIARTDKISHGSEVKQNDNSAMECLPLNSGGTSTKGLQIKQKFDKSEKPLKADTTEFPMKSCATDKEGNDYREHFNLITDGTQLTMPNSYKKLKSAHLRLNSQLRTDESEEDASREFLEQLESSFNAGSTGMSHFKLEMESKKLLKEHYELCKIIQSVAQQSADTDETSSWQEVYSCYCSWQFILTKFKELQKRTQFLLEAEEQLDRNCPCGDCTLYSQWQELYSQKKGKSNLPSGNVLLTPWLPSMRKELTVQDDCFTYTSAKELKEFVQLQHEVQLLNFQLEIERLAGEKLLPALKSSHHKSILAPLYRCVYGLLCHGSKVFPSMIIDSFVEQCE